MNTASMRRPHLTADRARGLDWAGVAIWLSCFAVVCYLGLRGGGYDPLVHDQVGIAAWWLLLAAVLVGALPRRRPGRVALGALAVLAAFVVWTALSLIWTENVESTSADVARLAGYLAVFTLAVLAARDRSARYLVSAVAAGISVVAIVALLSRLHPAWFPAAGETATFVSDSRERLSYPVNYWNGLGALVAIGLPLLLHLASSARTLLVRAAAAAMLPALALTLFFTLSRGSIAAAVLALAIYLSLAPDRVPRIAILVISGIGAGVLIALADSREALQHGLTTAAAHHEGNEMLAIAVVVCAIVAVAAVAVTALMAPGRRPRWTVISPRATRTTLIAGALLALVVAIALGLPGRASHGWSEFKRGGNPGAGANRLNSVAGQSRYQLWRAALDENASAPLIGTGAGTFQYWWARHATTSETVRDAHSLYLQTLGELGIVGLALLLAFIVLVLFGGGRLALAAPVDRRSALAAALAGCLAFLVTAAVDWMWELPVLAVSMLILAAVVVSGDASESRPGEEREPAALPLAARGAVAVVALIAIVAIAVPLASTSLLRRSEAAAQAGELSAALDEARSARNVLPAGAGPRLQEALVLERQGQLAAAAAAARSATERGSTDWQNWLVLSRIEAERGNSSAAVRDYQRAKSLNPRSRLFAP